MWMKSMNVTIQMKATEWTTHSCDVFDHANQGVSNSCLSVDEILKCDHSNENYWSEQYFPVVLFIMLYKVV